MLKYASVSWLCLSLAVLAGNLLPQPSSAQTVNAVQVPTQPLPKLSGPVLPPPQDVIPIPSPPTPTPSPVPPSPTAPPGQVLPPTSAPQPNEIAPDNAPASITVKRFDVEGSTVYEQKAFDEITKDYINRPISLAELFELRSKITKLYIDDGYITSGAYIPPQDLENGVVKIKISEGGVEAINVTGTHHLNPDYIRSRVALAATKPLNKNRLLETLKLLLLNQDRLIKNISTELSTGTHAGESLLDINVTEASIWEAQLTLDNGRTPSVGTFRRQLQLSNYDLLGFGDRLFIAYTNTDGSNGVDTSYTIPFNPRNGTITLSGGFSFSKVIEPPFDILDINSHSNYVELSVRQPILQSINQTTNTYQEFALGLTVSHRESGATLLGGEIPFPSPGADASGTTRVTALRFFQDYTIQNSRNVLVFRSQFGLGLGSLGALETTTDTPQENFFVWRGQAQYVRLLADNANTLLLLRGDIQLANKPLVPLEQFGLGGLESVRGYRQDQILTDSGIFLSAEVRIPIFQYLNPKIVLQFAPFIDFGHGFNQGSVPTPRPQNDLISVGLGLRFSFDDRVLATFDWGIPLTDIPHDNRTLQERGLYFSLIYKQPF